MKSLDFMINQHILCRFSQNQHKIYDFMLISCKFAENRNPSNLTKNLRFLVKIEQIQLKIMDFQQNLSISGNRFSSISSKNSCFSAIFSEKQLNLEDFMQFSAKYSDFQQFQPIFIKFSQIQSNLTKFSQNSIKSWISP